MTEKETNDRKETHPHKRKQVKENQTSDRKESSDRIGSLRQQKTSDYSHQRTFLKVGTKASNIQLNNIFVILKSFFKSI